MPQPLRVTELTSLSGPPLMGRWILPLMLLLWVASFWPYDDFVASNGSPYLADYAQFYVAGAKVLDGDFATLYDNADNQRCMLEVLPSLEPGFSLPFRYPPHVAVILAPLAMFSYPVAATLFAFISVATYVAVLIVLRRELAVLRNVPLGAYLAMAAGFPLVLETLIGGQLSIFGLASVVGAACLLRRNHPISAGVVLGLLCYKPNVALLMGLGCCLRYPKAILGGLVSGAFVVGVTLLTAGLPTLLTYVEVGLELAGGRWDLATPAWKVHGLGPWLEQLLSGLGNRFALSTGVLFVVAWTAIWWLKGVAFEIGFAGLVIANSIFGLYTPIYDLLLLGVAWVLLAEYCVENRFTSPRLHSYAIMATCLLWFGPHLSQLVATEIGMQPFSLLLAALAVTVVATQVFRLSSTRSATISCR